MKKMTLDEIHEMNSALADVITQLEWIEKKHWNIETIRELGKEAATTKARLEELAAAQEELE